MEAGASKQKHQAIQTDQLSFLNLKTVQSILSGPQVGAFCQIPGIFISGYRKLVIDSDILCVYLIYAKWIKFLKKLSKKISYVRTSCEAQNQANQHQLFITNSCTQKYKDTHEIKFYSTIV